MYEVYTYLQSAKLYYMASFSLRLEQYELLSDIQEIRGLLRIQGWDGVSFPYLRNLRIIGSQNGTKFTTTCGTGADRKDSSVVWAKYYAMWYCG